MNGYPETTEHGFGVSHTDHDNMNSSVALNGKVVKRFKGESAWSNAQRHAYDMATKARYAPDSATVNHRSRADRASGNVGNGTQGQPGLTSL